MGVRVNIELKLGEKIILTSAFANSGYETDEPEIHIPIALAKELGFKLKNLRGELYKVVGSEITTYTLGNILVRIVTEDKKSEWIRARAVTVPGEYEVILSDALIEALNMEIIKPRSGLWKFSEETKIRKSVEIKYWIE